MCSDIKKVQCQVGRSLINYFHRPSLWTCAGQQVFPRARNTNCNLKLIHMTNIYSNSPPDTYRLFSMTRLEKRTRRGHVFTLLGCGVLWELCISTPFYNLIIHRSLWKWAPRVQLNFNRIKENIFRSSIDPYQRRAEASSRTAGA